MPTCTQHDSLKKTDLGRVAADEVLGVHSLVEQTGEDLSSSPSCKGLKCVHPCSGLILCADLRLIIDHADHGRHVASLSSLSSYVISYFIINHHQQWRRQQKQQQHPTLFTPHPRQQQQPHLAFCCFFRFSQKRPVKAEIRADALRSGIACSLLPLAKRERGSVTQGVYQH